ncbi:endothelial cell-selective adhesion molecule isoform X2 [Rhineura floridana]|uniref:endothelial cell-selective adhesion molecule isoform X2 n=1 Tax=Rhineura floridana TaxID=261503 RepID=UPI002AC8822C|nr:endothelial cell-selective adhesion molecule isoform X2 [Rhineura floridana]
MCTMKLTCKTLDQSFSWPTSKGSCEDKMEEGNNFHCQAPWKKGLSSAVLEVHVGAKSVVVIQGQQAILPVWYTTHSKNAPFVTWHIERHGPRKHSQIMVYMTGATKVEDPDLNNRVGFLYPMPFNNVSIAINNTKEADSGQYMCTVNLLDDKSGKNIGLINLTVLVPPSTPKCQIHGSPRVGGNITMTCNSALGKPVPMYNWRRTGPSYQIFFEPVQDLKKGILMLTNLTTDMSGTYICNASSNAGYADCTVTLEVKPPFRAAVVAGAVVGSLIGLGLIILFPLQMFIYRRKKKDAQEEMANEIKEDAVAPKTLSWTKSPGSDASKNGTLSSMNTTRDQKLYPSKPASDTASITTATGSTVGYKPPFGHPRSGTLTPTPSLSSQSLPLYFPPVVNGIHGHHASVPVHRNALPRTNGAQPQQEPTAPQGLTSSTLNRMGAVPVMVPAQSQAGSLV